MNRFRENNFKGETLKHKDEPIYKYIRLDHLLLMLKASKMRIYPTSSWEDVYENFFYKYLIQLKDGRLVESDHLIKGVYGMSWTSLEESDAMWRIYSDKTNICNSAIRVKTSIGRLFDVIYPDVPEDREEMATTFIGFVKYYEDRDFDKWITDKEPITYLNLNEYIIESFFLKRYPFEHEKELRIIINKASNDSDFGKPYLEFDIDPNTLFDEFVMDPRLCEEDCTLIKKELLNYSIPVDRIRKSDLYEFNPRIIKFGL